jgi:aryl-alcohol dehydrogenase-like predicted oxidoreductase
VFDTADAYGLGRSEIELSRALGNRRHEAFIISKFGVRWQTVPSGGRARTFKDSSPTYLKTALESSLGRLKIEAIPLYLVHWPDEAGCLDDTLAALDMMRQEGKVLNYGLSNFSAIEIKKSTEKFSVSAVEGPYSLVDRKRGESMFRAARECGMVCMAYGTLAQGLLTGNYCESSVFESNDRRSRLPQFTRNHWQKNKLVLQVITDISQRNQKTFSQIAIRWVLDSGYVDTAIVGAKSPRQVEDNAGALNWQLLPEDLQSLEMASSVTLHGCG